MTFLKKYCLLFLLIGHFVPLQTKMSEKNKVFLSLGCLSVMLLAIKHRGSLSSSIRTWYNKFFKNDIDYHNKNNHKNNTNSSDATLKNTNLTDVTSSNIQKNYTNNFNSFTQESMVKKEAQPTQKNNERAASPKNVSSAKDLHLTQQHVSYSLPMQERIFPEQRSILRDPALRPWENSAQLASKDINEKSPINSIFAHYKHFPEEYSNITTRLYDLNDLRSEENDPDVVFEKEYLSLIKQKKKEEFFLCGLHPDISVSQEIDDKEKKKYVIYAYENSTIVGCLVMRYPYSVKFLLSVMERRFDKNYSYSSRFLMLDFVDFENNKISIKQQLILQKLLSAAFEKLENIQQTEIKNLPQKISFILRFEYDQNRYCFLRKFGAKTVFKCYGDDDNATYFKFSDNRISFENNIVLKNDFAIEDVIKEDQKVIIELLDFSKEVFKQPDIVQQILDLHFFSQKEIFNTDEVKNSFVETNHYRLNLHDFFIVPLPYESDYGVPEIDFSYQSQYFVAYVKASDGTIKIVGSFSFDSAMSPDSSGKIQTIVIRKDMRKKGILSRMFLYVLLYFKMFHYKGLKLQVCKTNQQAINAYNNLGGEIHQIDGDSYTIKFNIDECLAKRKAFNFSMMDVSYFSIEKKNYKTPSNEFLYQALLSRLKLLKRITETVVLDKKDFKVFDQDKDRVFICRFCGVMIGFLCLDENGKDIVMHRIKDDYQLAPSLVLRVKEIEERLKEAAYRID